MSRKLFAALSLALSLGAFARPGLAVNLLPNSGFDTGLAPWGTDTTLPSVWSSVDADGSPASGSAVITNSLPGPVGAAGAYSPCVAVTPGLHELSIDILIPAGQGSPGSTSMNVRTFATDECLNDVGGFSGPILSTSHPLGEWTRLTSTFTVPSGIGWIRTEFVLGRDDAVGSLSVHFDNAQICPGSCSGTVIGVGDFFTDAEYPGFRFRVTIFRPGEEPLAGVKEAECLEELVCVSGALPGRAEVFLRIIGPRPNGYLWPTILRATSSGLLVEIEQISTGVIRSYILNAVPQGDITDLTGLQDRKGFLP